MPASNLRRTHNGVYAWWEKDADLDLSYVGPLPERGHETCNHRHYLLTCKQYEYLLRRSGGRCEICHLPAEENTSGRLYIDHDPARGRWAVRGLLCRTCNATERFSHVVDARRYHESAWYWYVITAKDEPPIGALVRDHAERPWERTADGWVARFKLFQAEPPQTWDELVYRYGAHNLHVTCGVAA